MRSCRSAASPTRPRSRRGIAADGPPGAALLDIRAESTRLLASYRERALVLWAVGLAIIVALLALHLRSALRVAQVLAPIAGAVAAAAAILLVAGTKLTLFHLVALLLVAGVGSNYALFFEREPPDEDAAARTVFAVAFCAATTALAFGLLAWSQVAGAEDDRRDRGDRRGGEPRVRDADRARPGLIESPRARAPAADPARFPHRPTVTPLTRHPLHRRQLPRPRRRRVVGGAARAPLGARGVRLRGRGARHLHRPGRRRRGRDAAGAARGVRLPQQPARLARPRAGRLRETRASQRASATVRAASPSSWGPAPPASLSTERAYQHRDPGTGALPADFRYAETQSTYSLAAFVRAALGLEGPAHVVSTACSSSAKVFASAARMIERGVRRRRGRRRRGQPVPHHAVRLPGARAALDRAVPAVRRRAERHLDRRGRGLRAARAVGTPGRVLAGVGESCDAYHMSTPHPEGLGARLAMERALAAGGLAPAAVGYVNLHGTATRTNDVAEGRAVVRRVRPADAVQRDQGRARPPARRRGHHRSDRRAARARARRSCPGRRTRARSTSKPPAGC